MPMKPGAARRLLLSLAVVFSFLTWAPSAYARELGRIGSGSCSAASEPASPGSSVRIAACFERDGDPFTPDRVVFVEYGPAPTDAAVVTPTSGGEAIFEMTSHVEGRSRVMACIPEVCSPPLTIEWSEDGSSEEVASDAHPPVTAPPGAGSNLEPQIEGISAFPDVDVTSCATGATTRGPAFVDITGVSSAESTHPRSGRLTEVRKVALGSPMLPGSVLYRATTLVTLLAAPEDGPVDRREGPLAGAGRAFAFYSYGDGRIGKFEMVFDGSRWVDVTPSFTVTLQGSDVTFFSDDEPFPTSMRAFARADGMCDASGSALKVPGPDRTVAVVVGLLILALMTGLTVAILRSSEPPSKGIPVTEPGGPEASFERSDVRYDQLGRPLGFVDIVETAPGVTHTVRATIDQESLMVDAPDVLDPFDWEDETLRIERSDLTHDRAGRISAFVETVASEDGTAVRTNVGSIRYDDHGRVVRFERIIDVEGGLASRTESVSLSHEGSAASDASLPGLCLKETVRRSGLRYDADGHVTASVCTSFTDGTASLSDDPSGVRIDAPVPQPMWMAGIGFPDVPVVVSAPNKGVVRLRNILTRWFRAHGCKVELVLTDPLGNPLPDLAIKFGRHLSHVDRRGHQTFWVLTGGNYAISTVEGFIPSQSTGNGDTPTDRYVPGTFLGWICVSDIPGTATARFAVPVPVGRSSVREG